MSLDSMQLDTITVADPLYTDDKKNPEDIEGWNNEGRYQCTCDPMGSVYTNENGQEGEITTWEIISNLIETTSQVERNPLRRDARLTLPNGKYARIVSAERFAQIPGSSIPTYWHITAEESVQTS